MSRTPDRVRAQRHPHNVTEAFMMHPNVPVLVPSPYSSRPSPSSSANSSRPSSITHVHKCAVCTGGFVPASPLGAGAPGDSAIHCPACVLSVLESVSDAITSGNVSAFEALARAKPTLVMDARLSDVVLRCIIAARLLASQGDGKGKGGNSAVLYASSKEVEDEADSWYRDDRRTVTIEWTGILELNLYSNALHVAVFVSLCPVRPSAVAALYSIIEVLHDVDVAEVLLAGCSSSSSSSSSSGMDAVSAAKFYGKAKSVLPPPHLDARHKAPVTVARELGASNRMICLLVDE